MSSSNTGVKGGGLKSSEDKNDKVKNGKSGKAVERGKGMRKIYDQMSP